MCDCTCSCYTELLITCTRPGFHDIITLSKDEAMIKLEDEDYAILRQTLINMKYFAEYHRLYDNNCPLLFTKKSCEQLLQEITENEDYAALRQTLINMEYFDKYYRLYDNNHSLLFAKKSREQLRQEATEQVDANLANPNFK